MIIVSQDEDTITNFNNIEIVGIGTPLEDNEGKFRILVNTISGEQYTIAKYTTEERAKEVLNEMTRKYETSKRYECSNININIFIEAEFIYEMPKE